MQSRLSCQGGSLDCTAPLSINDLVSPCEENKRIVGSNHHGLLLEACTGCVVCLIRVLLMCVQDRLYAYTLAIAM
jgi:hypothetical protein